MLVIAYCIGIIFAIYSDFLIVICVCHCTFLCGCGLCLNLDDLRRMYENEYDKGTERCNWLRFENWYCCEKYMWCMNCVTCDCCHLTSLWHDYNA